MICRRVEGRIQKHQLASDQKNVGLYRCKMSDGIALRAHTTSKDWNMNQGLE